MTKYLEREKKFQQKIKEENINGMKNQKGGILTN